MTFVKDTAEGFITVGLCDKVIGQTVNLGVGHGETIGTMVKTILKILGKEQILIEQDPARIRPSNSEVMRLISNNSIAKEVCGWKPKYDLESGLAQTVEWIKQNLDKYKPDRYAI
jgi:dTDP-glucose 4,6-dehydratase